MQHNDKTMLFKENPDFGHLKKLWQSLSSSEIDWVKNFKNAFEKYLIHISNPSQSIIRQRVKILIQQQPFLEQFKNADALFKTFLDDLIKDISENKGEEFEKFIIETVADGLIDIITMLNNNIEHKNTKQEIANIKAGLPIAEIATEKKATSSNIPTDNTALTEALTEVAHLKTMLLNQLDIIIASKKFQPALIMHLSAHNLLIANKFNEAEKDFQSAIALLEDIDFQNVLSNHQTHAFYLLADSWASLSSILSKLAENDYSSIDPIANNFKKAIGYLVKFSNNSEYKTRYDGIITEMFSTIANVTKIASVQSTNGNRSNAESCYKSALALLNLLTSQVDFKIDKDPFFFFKKSITYLTIQINLIVINIQSGKISNAIGQLKECRDLITASLEIENIPEMMRSEFLNWKEIMDFTNATILKAIEIPRSTSSAKLFSDNPSAALSTKTEKPSSELKSDQKDIPVLSDANKSNISDSSSAALSAKAEDLIQELKLDINDILGLSDADISKVYDLKKYLKNYIEKKEPQLSIKEIIALNKQEVLNLITGYAYLTPFRKNNNKPLLSIDQLRNLSEDQRKIILIQGGEAALIDSYKKLCQTFKTDPVSDRKMSL